MGIFDTKNDTRKTRNPMPPIPPIAPRPMPKTTPLDMEEIPGEKKQMVSNRLLIGCGAVLFIGMMLVIAGLAFALWVFVSANPHSDQPRAKPAIPPSVHYLKTYADGNALAWSQALEAFDAGEFRDWKDAEDYLAPKLKEVVNKAEQPGIDLVSTINGKLWVSQTDDDKSEVEVNRAAARKVFQTMIKGYQR